MATTYPTEGYLILANVSFSGTEGEAGSTLSWTGIYSTSDINYDVFDDNEDGDLDVGLDQFAGSGATYTGYTITVAGVEYPVFTAAAIYYVPLPVDGYGQTIIPSSGTTNKFQDEVDISATFLCFGPGTMIGTPEGEVAVERLKIGDHVTRADGGSTEVLWLGRQTLYPAIAGPRMQPVRIRAGALGDGLPHSDLVVTADHGMVLDGMVINASALVNGDSIDFVPLRELPHSFTVYHIETSDHDVIMANGAPSETFIDAAGRAAFDNYQEYLDLYGYERIIPEMPALRVSSRRLLPEQLRDQTRAA